MTANETVWSRSDAHRIHNSQHALKGEIYCDETVVVSHQFREYKHGHVDRILIHLSTAWWESSGVSWRRLDSRFVGEK